MKIIVCIKRVPDLAEVEVEINASGRGIVEDDLAFTINEWDNFAVETAVQLKELHGGKVTAMTVGGVDDEEVLRRALAMGADEAVHLMDGAFETADGAGIATILSKAIAQRTYDLVLTGAISGDVGAGVVGGMVAEFLGIPWVSLATGVDIEGRVARVRHEVEGGLERIVELDLPALATIQTGINEPRYVSIRGIRKVRDVDIPVMGAADLGLEPGAIEDAAGQHLRELFLPAKGDGAEILEGDDEEVVEALVGRLKERGGL